MGQITLSEIEAKDWIVRLKDRDLDILRLVSLEGIPASRTARLKRVSKAHVSRLIAHAVDLHLLTPISTRPYNQKYRAESPLKAHLQAAEDPGKVRPYTVCRPHNIRLKYRITLQEAPLSRDRRAGFQKAWKPRGPERLLFWIPGRVDMGSVTIEAHPGSLVAYYSAHQEVVAESVAAAEVLMVSSIHEAVLRFVTLQARHGCRMDLEAPTSRAPEALARLQVSETHYAYKASREGPLGAMVGQRVGPWWVDGSPMDAGDPDHVELETKDLQEATALDLGIKAIQAMGRGAPVPAAGQDLLREMEKKLGSMEETVKAIHAMVASGTDLQYRYDQVVGILAGTMKNLEAALGRIETLERAVFEKKG